jgi:hypothetical protein
MAVHIPIPKNRTPRMRTKTRLFLEGVGLLLNPSLNTSGFIRYTRPRIIERIGISII